MHKWLFTYLLHHQLITIIIASKNFKPYSDPLKQISNIKTTQLGHGT